MKPILFNTEMVRAILDGRKTATRRCVKLPKWIIEEPNGSYSLGIEGTWYPNQEIEKMFDDGYLESKYMTGDTLYVRETWNQLARVDEDGYTHYDELAYVYKADKIQSDLYDDSGMYLDDTHRKWKPSIHMPKEAARLFLRVTDVRVEKLSNMLGRDCRKEGINSFTKDGDLFKYAVSENWWNDYHRHHKSLFCGTPWQDMPVSIFVAFSYLWNSTIEKHELDQFGWNANPWVFVYEFEVISKEKAYDDAENYLEKL